MVEKKEHAEHKEHSESKEHESKKKKYDFSKVNYWMVATIILAIVLLLGAVVPHGISKKTAEKKITDLAAASGMTLTVLGTDDKGSFYGVNYSIQGQNGTIDISKDGKYIGQLSAYPQTTKTPSASSTQNTQSATAPKADKPNVQLFVFSYCPYGTQTEKGLIPVYNLLKNKANITIEYIGAMHGKFEETESLRQLCIQKNYGQDKFMSYIANFNANASVGSCSGADACVNPIVNSIMSSLGINANTISTCMTKDAPALYAAQEQKAASLGISGSPTLVVNGVQIQSGRSPAALLSTVCSAFNTAPAECSQTLDSATPSAGFGGSTGASTGASCGA